MSSGTSPTINITDSGPPRNQGNSCGSLSPKTIPSTSADSLCNKNATKSGLSTSAANPSIKSNSATALTSASTFNTGDIAGSSIYPVFSCGEYTETTEPLSSVLKSTTTSASSSCYLSTPVYSSSFPTSGSNALHSLSTPCSSKIPVTESCKLPGCVKTNSISAAVMSRSANSLCSKSSHSSRNRTQNTYFIPLAQRWLHYPRKCYTNTTKRGKSTNSSPAPITSGSADSLCTSKPSDTLENSKDIPITSSKGGQPATPLFMSKDYTFSPESESTSSNEGDEFDTANDAVNKKGKETPVHERLCEICGKLCANKSALTYHNYAFHREKRFKCTECSISFIFQCYLDEHLSVVHGNSRPFVCKTCGSTFKKKSQLKGHILTHSGKRKYQCVHCDKGFKIKWHHDEHQVSHDGNVFWTCEGCGDKFKIWDEYTRHVKDHFLNRTFNCDICKKSFARKRFLRLHVLTHLRVIECPVCGKMFGSRQVMRIHQTIHTGEKKYICKLCDREFAQYAGLKTHYLVHSDARPFKCQVCDKGFKTKRDVRRHEKIHQNRREQ